MSENMDKKELMKVNEVAAVLGETVHVIRNWVRDFRSYIPIYKGENGYNMFDQKSIEVIRTIQNLIRHQKYSTRQVEKYLATDGKAFAAAALETSETIQQIAEMREMLENQKHFNRELLTRLDAQQKYIEMSIAQRDEKLTLALREMREDRTARARRWYHFFTRR